MSSGAKFSERVSALRAQVAAMSPSDSVLQACTSGSGAAGLCVPTPSKSLNDCVPKVVIYGAVAFVAVWLILYFMQPKFVKSQDGDKLVRNKSKVFFWTLGLSALLWAGLYAWSKYGSGAGLICAV